MAAEERWYFTKEQLGSSPSRKCGLDADKELSNRQQAANFMQDLGQRIHVNQLCINTAIVYMHRFYMFHSFTKFHRHAISICSLFLAAKVEEQPRKLEFILKWAHVCLHRDSPGLDQTSEGFLEQAQELVINENIMLQTLGFDVAIDHPHTHVVKCCQLVRASKDLAQTSYFMATNSLHLTTMSVQYKPTVVACVCIHLACKWASWEIPKSSEGKTWFWYVDRTVTDELLEELTTEFVAILDRCPSRLKRKMLSCGGVNDKLPDEIMALDKITSFTSNSQPEQDRERASAGASTSSRAPAKGGHLFDNGPVPVNQDKNGSVAGITPLDAKGRSAAKKERETNAHSSSSRPSSSGLSGAAPPSSSSAQVPLSAAPPAAALHRLAPGQVTSPAVTSPRRGQTTGPGVNSNVPATSTSMIASAHADNLPTSQSTSPALSRKSTKPDGGNRLLTTKEYHERKKREQLDRESERVPPLPNLANSASSAPPANQKQPVHARSEQQRPTDRESASTAKGFTLANSNSGGSSRPNQVPPSSGAGGARPSHHHHHPPHHNRKTPDKQRHHQQQPMEVEQRHRSATTSNSGGHYQRGPPPLAHVVGEEKTVLSAGPSSREGDGNHVGRPVSKSVTRPTPVALPPARQVPPRPLLTPSPPPQEDDHDELPEVLAGGCGDLTDTLVNPLDGRAMVIPAMDSRGTSSQPWSRNNHSIPTQSATRVVDKRRRDERPEEQQLPAKRHELSVKDKKERLIKHHRSKMSADPSLIPPLTQQLPPSTTSSNPVPSAVQLPPAKQQPNLGHSQVLPNPHPERAEPSWTDARQTAASNAMAFSHHHSAKLEPISAGARRPGIGTSLAPQQPAKLDFGLAEGHRSANAPPYQTIKVEPYTDEKAELAQHVSRSKVIKGEVAPVADARRSAGPQQQQPQHHIKVEPLESKRSGIVAGLLSPIVDSVQTTGSVESKLIAGAVSSQHHHPALLGPMSPIFNELKHVPGTAHQTVKVEVALPAVNSVKIEPAEAPKVPSVKEILASAPPVVPLASVVREPRAKVTAPPKENRVVVAPSLVTEEMQAAPTREVADAVKSRTSTRREGKEKSKSANPPVVAISSAEVMAKSFAGVPHSSAKVSPQLMAPIAPIKSESPVLALSVKPMKVEQPASVVQTHPHPSPAPASLPKHERREKHRHKDKDRSSKERKREDRAAAALQQASTPPPSIKLTIAKDRLTMSNNVDGISSRVPSCSPKDGGPSGLKIKIPKDKLGSSSNSKGSASKSHNSLSSTLVVTNSDGNGNGSGSGGSVPSLGLKIKITKDRSGSKVMSVESTKDRPPTMDANPPHRENRKREREPSPKMASSTLPNDASQPPIKTIKLTRATARRNSETGSRGATPEANVARPGDARTAAPTTDVPPSSNTRSSRQDQQQQQHHASGGGGPRHQSERGRGRGGGYRGGPKGVPPNKQHHMGHPGAPNMAYGHQGGPPYYPQQQPYYPQYPPPHHPHPSVANYFNHPPPHQFYNQPPPYGPPGPYGGPMPPHPHQGHRYPMMPPQGPPLPREPPPAIPPPPPE